MAGRSSHEHFRACAPNFLHFQRLISETDWAPCSLPYIKRFLEDRETEAASTKRLVDTLNEKRINHHGGTDHRSHQNPFSRVWHRHHNQSGGEIGGQVWPELEQLRDANRKLNDQTEKVNDGKALYHECINSVRANERAKGDLKALLERLFAPCTPSTYPSERAIEQSLNEERAKANELEITKSSYVVTIPSLRQALRQIKTAFKVLEEGVENNADYEGRIANHWPHDLNQADRHRAKAAGIISDVLKYDPSIPHLCDVDLGSHPFESSPSNEDPVDDMVELRNIMQKPARMLEKDVVDPLVREARSLDEELRECHVNIGKLEASLFAERTRIVAEILADFEGGSKGLQIDVCSNESPPAYS